MSDQPALLNLTWTRSEAFACLGHVEHLTITLGIYSDGREISELTNKCRGTLNSLCLVGEFDDAECWDAIDALVKLRFPRLEHLVFVSLNMECRPLNYLFAAYRHQLKTIRLRQIRLERSQAVVIDLCDDSKMVTQPGYISDMTLNAEALFELSRNKEIADKMEVGDECEPLGSEID